MEQVNQICNTLKAVNELIGLINQALSDRDWSMATFAEKARVSSSTLSNVLNEKTAPSFEFCCAVAPVLGLHECEALSLAGLIRRPPALDLQQRQLLDAIRAVPDELIDTALVVLRGLAGSGADRPKVEPGPADRQPETIAIGQTRQHLVELLYTNRGLPVPHGGEIPVNAELANVLFDEIERHEQDIDRLAEYFFAVTLRNVRGGLVEKFAKAVQSQAERQIAREERPEHGGSSL